MARKIDRLTALAVASAKGPKYHADGGGLYLQVTAKGAHSWVFLFRWQGRRAEMGPGSAAAGAVSLADARDARDDARKLVRDGINPIEARRAESAVQAPQTFGDVASERLKPSLLVCGRSGRHAGSMGKYDPLSGELRRQSADQVHMSFAEIERCIGAMLPKSAQLPQWWANAVDPQQHIQQRAWLDAGYDAFLIARADRVRFERRRH